MKRICVAGGGGFIGSHLIKRLKQEGHWVRGVDLKYPEWSKSTADEFQLADLRHYAACVRSLEGIDEVYHLAANMGGISWITKYHAQVARDNSLINIHMLDAAVENKVKKFLFSSSACVYAQKWQQVSETKPLKEEDAWPADPEKGYGLEKLYMEELCRYYREDYGLDTRVVRFHNVYGPEGTWDGGKEKAPAALCRKIAKAKNGDEIEVWGDGQQTRSFLYIDDCVEGLIRLMESGYQEPLNLGSDRLISVNDLFLMIARASNKVLVMKHDTSKPQGVRGRNSDNTKLREVLGWEPKTTLEEGIEKTYKWIEAQVCSSKG